MDFPRLQFAIFSVLLAVLQLTFLDYQQLSSWLQIAVVLACGAWQLWWIAPYTRLWPVEVESNHSSPIDRTLSIMTANVLTPNRNVAVLLALVSKHKPDVLVTLESDRWWEERLEVLESEMEHTIKCPLDNLYGMHVYSRLALEESEISYLVEDNVPSIHTMLSLRNGEKIRMHFLHPAPPSPTENTTSSERDAELIVVAQSIAGSDQPVIVTGDLNDVAWSSTTRLFRKISGLLDPRVGRGMFNTFNAKIVFFRWPLDHLFHSPHFAVRSIERLPKFGSDHFALLTELVYKKEGSPEQEGLSSDASDESRAMSIAEQEGVHDTDVPTPGV